MINAEQARTKSSRAGTKVVASRLALVGLALIAASALAGCGRAAGPAGAVAGETFVASQATKASAVATATASPSPVPTPLATPSAAPSAPADAIQVREWKVTMPTEVKAGMVSFTITNAGTTAHELIGFRSALDPVAYPRKPNGDVNEEGKGITPMTDGPDIEPGMTQTRTIDLTTPGKYTFMCNLPGHFQQGMYTVVTVTP